MRPVGADREFLGAARFGLEAPVLGPRAVERRVVAVLGLARVVFDFDLEAVGFAPAFVLAVAALAVRFAAAGFLAFAPGALEVEPRRRVRVSAPLRPASVDARELKRGLMT
ncbi:hypothetical protein BH10ACT11_BH10ACT11_21320 [soil metagenome]